MLRKSCVFSIILLFILATMVDLGYTQLASPEFELIRDSNNLVVYFPDQGAISITSFTFSTVVDGEEVIHDLTTLPVLRGLPFGSLPTPFCVRLSRIESNSPLPLQCPPNATVAQTLLDANVFWYDSLVQQDRNLTIQIDDTFVGICLAGQSLCSLGDLSPVTDITIEETPSFESQWADEILYSTDIGIFIRNLITGEESLVSVTGQTGRSPIWSEDGSQIAYLASDVLSNDRIYLVQQDANENWLVRTEVGNDNIPKSCLLGFVDDSLFFSSPIENDILIYSISITSSRAIQVQILQDAVLQSCVTFGTGSDINIIYAANRDGDAEIYMRSLSDPSLEVQLTNNDIDDLMPNCCGRGGWLIYYRETVTPDIYDVISTELRFLDPNSVLAVPFTQEEVLFQTRQISRVTWGDTGRNFYLGIDGVGFSAFGIAAYGDNVSRTGRGPVTLNTDGTATDPQIRPNQP